MRDEDFVASSAKRVKGLKILAQGEGIGDWGLVRQDRQTYKY